MTKKSIARRWALNTLGVVAFILIVINISAFYLVKSYYYSSVDTYIQSEASIISSVLARYYADTATNYSSEIRTMVETFDKKEEMELMAISGKGRVTITSSGFSPLRAYKMPDYEAALKSEDGTGTYTGVLDETGSEKIKAVTVLVQQPNSSYSAMRLVVSLENIDAQISVIVMILLMVSAGIILIIIISGFYFIKSIVIPLRQVSSSAQKLATGDFSVRIEPRTNDEIGELCNVFNYMADELENSETIKNDFISSVSHELRTPLTAIKGWSETITGTEDAQTIRKGMRVITSEAERLSEMVEELLDFSRIQNGRFTLDKANIDVLAELADALLIYTEKAKKDGISIHYNEPEFLAVVYGDKNRLRQVFVNIIDNAIKYSDANGNIMIEAYENEQTITITISDEGCGISETDLPKVKNKFYKANHTRRGSGIGLAVADEIVQMHDGALDIVSKLNEGTTVTITLPTVNKKDKERTTEIE